MIFHQIHKHISFIKLCKLVLGMAIALQVVVIVYNHLSGYHELSGLMEFGLRFLRGVFYSTIAGFAIVYPDLAVIKALNINLPWNKCALKRIVMQFLLMLLIAVSVSTLITLFAHWVSNYRQGLHNVLINNLLIYSVVNAFFMALLEAWIYLDESVKERVKAEKLQEDLIAEAANRAMYEAQLLIGEEKNKYNDKLIEQERQQNQILEEEIKKREIITRQLHENRMQLNSILSNLPGAAYRCYFDEQYTMQYISEKIFDISGFHASEFTGNNAKSYVSLIHPDDQVVCRENIRKALADKTHFEFEYRVIHKNGSVLWVNENGKGISNEAGEIIYLDGIIVDITRRKEAEFAADESQRNFKELMDFLPQPVFELNLKGEVVFGNKAGYEFFGPQPDDPNLRLSAFDCFVKEDIPQIIENFKKSNQGILTEPTEYTAIKSDGSLCPVLVFGSPIIKNGEMVGRRGLIIDISERKKQELKLIEAKEALERVNNTLEQRVAERTNQLTEANTRLLKVQQENLQSQFEVLKQQINPHFLFNSLNVLSSLISKDTSKAQQFIDEFSQIYRYVLETIEKTVVTLAQELSFARSYIYLQQIRYGEHLVFTVNLPSNLLSLYLPPLSLQVVLENAMKHNVVNEGNYLYISILHENDWLVISNNIQPRISMGRSTGLGQANMVKRYALISSKTPEFQLVNNQYIVKLPLLNVENDERAYN